MLADAAHRHVFAKNLDDGIRECCVRARDVHPVVTFILRLETVDRESYRRLRNSICLKQFFDPCERLRCALQRCLPADRNVLEKI